MKNFKVLALNELPVDLESVLSGYEIIRQNFSHRSDYLKISFDIVIIGLNFKSDLNIISYFRSIPECNPVPILCLLNPNLMHLKTKH